MYSWVVRIIIMCDSVSVCVYFMKLLGYMIIKDIIITFL